VVATTLLIARQRAQRAALAAVTVPATTLQVTPQATPSATNDTPVEVFAMSGTSLTIQTAALSTARGFDELKLTVANSLGESLAAYDVLLFTLTPEGELQSIEGRRLLADLRSGGTADASFRPELPIEKSNLLLVAVRAVVGEFTVKEADPAELLRAAVKFKAKGTPPTVRIKDKARQDEVPDVNFCHTAFVLGQLLQKDQKDYPVVGTTCDQSNQAFQLLFKTKAQLKDK
jgi:hypothetical protein